MVDLETVHKLALSLPDTDEHDHWGRPSYRVKKRIFLTLWPSEKRAVVKLSLVDQSVFCKYNNTIFYSTNRIQLYIMSHCHAIFVQKITDLP